MRHCPCPRPRRRDLDLSSIGSRQVPWVLWGHFFLASTTQIYFPCTDRGPLVFYFNLNWINRFLECLVDFSQEAISRSAFVGGGKYLITTSIFVCATGLYHLSLHLNSALVGCMHLEIFLFALLYPPCAYINAYYSSSWSFLFLRLCFYFSVFESFFVPVIIISVFASLQPILTFTDFFNLHFIYFPTNLYHFLPSVNSELICAFYNFLKCYIMLFKISFF